MTTTRGGRKRLLSLSEIENIERRRLAQISGGKLQKMGLKTLLKLYQETDLLRAGR
jgi:translation initiation factor RLI1